MLALWARVLYGWKSDLIRVRSSTVEYIDRILRQVSPSRSTLSNEIKAIIGEQLGQGMMFPASSTVFWQYLSSLLNGPVCSMDEKRDLTGVIRHFNQLLSEHSPKKLVEKSSFFTVAPPLAPPSGSIFEKCHMRARSVQLVTRLHAELATLRREKGVLGDPEGLVPRLG